MSEKEGKSDDKSEGASENEKKSEKSTDEKSIGKKTEKGEKSGEKTERSEKTEIQDSSGHKEPLRVRSKSVSALSKSNVGKGEGSDAAKKRAQELKNYDTLRRKGSLSEIPMEDEKFTARGGSVPKALKRDRSMSGNLAKKTTGLRAKFSNHTLDRVFGIENGVFTYSSGKNKDPSFKIPLEELKAEKLDIKNDIKKGRFAFQIISAKKNLVLYASSEEERDEWLLQLRPRRDGEGDACASFSKFVGDLNVTVGKEYTWMIQGIDRYEQFCVEGGNKIRAILRQRPYTIHLNQISSEKSPETLSKQDELISNGEKKNTKFEEKIIKFDDNDNGTYYYKFTPKETAMGTLKIEVEGEEIIGSPFEFEFVPGSPDLSHSTLTGEGLSDTKMYMNSRFLVSMFDHLGNPSPGLKPNVKIVTVDSGEDAKFDLKIEPFEEQGHLWEVVYIADRQGEFKILIEVTGKSWGEFTVKVTKAPASSSKSMASGPGLKKVYQYKQTSFKINVNDERGRKCLGDHKIACKFLSNEGKDLGKFDCKISKNEDDTWSVNYIPEIGGSVKMHVLLYDQDIQGSPFAVDVAPAKAAIDKVTITGPGLKCTNAYQPTGVTVLLHDIKGQRVIEADVGVAFGERQADWKITDNKDGSFDIHFTPTQPGLLIMTVTVDGKQVKGSPFQLNIKESSEPRASLCYAEGPGIYDCVQYQRSDFSVFLRDEKNNPVSKGTVRVFLEETDAFEFSVDRSSVDSSYYVRYKSTAPPAEYTMHVTVEGEDIAKSPFRLTVDPGNPEDETSLSAGYPRLIRLSAQAKYVITTLMPLTVDSLNTDDVFLLDNELTVYQWNGPNTSRMLKLAAGHIIKVLNYDRRSAMQHKIIEDAYNGDADSSLFWELLGVTGKILPRNFSGDSKDPGLVPRLFMINGDDESMKLVAEGPSIKSDLLNPDCVMVLDTGFEVWFWEGRNCKRSGKKYTYQAGKDYIRKFKRPREIVIKRVLEGSESWTIRHYLDAQNVL